MQSDGGHRIKYDCSVLSPFEPKLFDLKWLRETGRITATSQGRNVAFFISHDGIEMVLRKYYRGGMIGRFNKDLFLRVPPSKSRPIAEFNLLYWMHSQGLAVPRPIAARVSPAGLFYRGSILTETIPNSLPLADRLLETPLRPGIWEKVGGTIAQMHQMGVHHSDLNCRNILIDQHDAIWLIDFDKCDRRQPGPWQNQNLARLHRSFTKELTKQPGLHWNDAAWQSLMAGYQAATTPPQPSP